MAKKIISDALWVRIEPLLPPKSPQPKGGRPWISDRAALTGILFVLQSGLPWEMLPQEMGCGSGMTCWRRLRDWQAAGVWQKLHEWVLNELGSNGQIDWSRASADASTVPAKHGGSDTGKNPTDRGKKGTKRHLVVDRKGHILVAEITGANVNETTQLTKTVDDIPKINGPKINGPKINGPKINGKRLRARHRPKKLHADKGYSSLKNRRELRKRHITPRIARKGIESSQKLGKHRWVVERAFGLINQFRRLRIRDERQGKLYHAFLLLAATVINIRTFIAT